MELAARGEFGRCLAFLHRGVLQAVIAKHAFHRPDDFLKDNPCRRLIGRFYAHLEISFPGLDQLDAPCVLVLQIEHERRQRHSSHVNERSLAAFHLKTAERRPTRAGVRVETKAVAEVISDDGLNVVGEHRQQHGRRQRTINLLNPTPAK